MASISRRNGHREVNAWPGWVDALSSLIMVVMFLLMVFAVAQVYLASAITGRDEQLTRLNTRMAELNELLSLERESNAGLRRDIARMSGDLQAAAAAREDMTSQLAALQDERDQLARAAEELNRTVAADRETIELRLREVASLQSDLKALREARERLETEVAALTKLGAALRERAETAERGQAETGEALRRADEAQRRTDEQRQRLLAEVGSARTLAEAADKRTAETADALRLSEEQRRRLLADLDAERGSRESAEKQRAETADALRLTEEQKRLLMAEFATLRDRSMELETTLADAREKTVLAQKAIDQRDIRISELLAALDASKAALSGEQQLTTQSRVQISLLNQQIAALREQLARVAGLLDASEKKAEEQRVQIADLGSRLNQALASKVQELARYRSEFFGRVREALGDRPDVRVVGDRFVFQSELLFPSGAAALEPAGRERLGQLAHSLTEVAKTMPPDINWVLRVDGHTDVRPISNAQFPSNWELSAARAIQVAKYLIDQGIPPTRLAVAGFGEHQPLDSGTGEDAMARNRRIELKLDQR